MWVRSVLVALFLLLTPGVAAAAPLGKLVVTPGESRDAAPVRLTTAAGCPAAATGYFATMRGAGLPDAGIVIVANGDVGLTHDKPFEVPVTLTFKDLAADNNVTFKGKYELALHCIDSFSQQSFGAFTGSIDFGADARYVAIGEAKGPQRPAAPLAPETASAPTVDPQTAVPPSPEEVWPEAAAAESGGTQPFLHIAIGVVGGGVVIALGMALFRRRPSSRGDADA
ncbi:hypothetical protein SK803_17140 [Lentzea sp. BCCO 10_0856]|uniref:LPXTG-motif cell wall anchor domain-containing protein n=1 Tax=Lentzea miocenica TaxID=3095431 RepID=A0ABU4T1C6_9PSEU|nr:hypothetical protein [Lentzea sp. BCCO 10_0856]MDX8031953.1 hypothetical protein [Lentzea sp. BCCO 10_0856]